MLNKLKTAVTRCNMLSSGDSVTVALSGGADSTALLHGLLAVREQYDLHVSAVHVNHMLRGDESDRDENFVREMCASLGVPLTVGRFDINRLAAESGEGTEACARRIRYAFLSENASGKIATAHTADDNVETVLLNLIRGAGVKGACGIPPVRGNIIRPLIYCSRADIEQYCTDNSLSYVTDSTNLTDDYTRNKLRHAVVPVMRGINPSLCDSITRFCASMREADELISSLAEKAVEDARDGDGYRCEQLSECYDAVLARAVSMIVRERTGAESDSLHCSQVCDIIRFGGRRQMPKGGFAVCENGMLTFTEKMPTEKNVTPCYDFVNKTVNFGAKCIKTEILSGLNVNDLLTNAMLDYDKIIGVPVLRTRLPGDAIRLQKRANKSLKKLFCELKIPCDQRGELPVIADDGGVVYVLGIGCDRRVAPDKNTKNYLIISEVDGI